MASKGEGGGVVSLLPPGIIFEEGHPGLRNEVEWISAQLGELLFPKSKR